MCDYAKSQLKIFNALPELKLIMFSKENSSEEISFTQPPQAKVRAMGSSFKEDN